MADADVAFELEHVMLLEHIAHQATALAHVQLALGRGRDAGGILAAVLQHGQRVIQTLVDRTGADDADDAAHAVFSPLGAYVRGARVRDVDFPHE